MTERRDQVLMIDARNVYHVVSARSHVFTEEQLANLTAIIWLYRGEQDKFVALVGRYQRRVDDWLAELPARVAADTAAVQGLATSCRPLPNGTTLAELNADQPKEAQLTQGQLDAFKAELAAAQADTQRQTPLPPCSPPARRPAPPSLPPTSPATRDSQPCKPRSTPWRHR